MLRTDAVIKLLKNNKTDMSFEDIWTNIKEETMESISKNLDEMEAKADMYTSMLEEPLLIMVGDNRWNLKEAFSYEEIEGIKKERITIEDDIVPELEESDDTKELHLEILNEIAGEDE